MRLYVFAPLAVAALCLLWIYLANRRPRIRGVVIPPEALFSGDVHRPVLQYDGEVVLGGVHAFEAIRCRSLRIAHGADVRAESIEAGRVIVEGRLSHVRILSAAQRLDVRGGDLRVDDVRSPLIRVDRTGRAVVLTVTGKTRVKRHARADVKGFFADLEEAIAVGAAARLSSWAAVASPR